VKTRSRFAALVLAAVALAAPALAQIPVMLPEFQVNTSPPGDNDANSVTLGDDGRFIVTWIEFGESNSEVIGRRFDPPDAPAGDPFQLNEFTPNYQQNSSVARDESGRFVAVWADDQNTSIRGRRFGADGTPLGGNIQVSTFTQTSMTYPHVASDPSGNFVVAWTRFTGAGGVGIARRFDSNGAPLSDEFPVNVFTPGFKNLSGVAMSPSGFVVSWFGAHPPAGNGSSAYAIFARRFDADGKPMTGDLQVNTSSLLGEYSRPDVAMNGAGDFVVVWHDVDSYNFATSSGRRFASDGTPMGDVFPMSTGSASAIGPHVASDGTGNFLVAWQSEDADRLGIAARYWDIGGFPVSSEFVVNEITTGYQFHPDVGVARDGTFVVSWTGGLGLHAFDVKGRKSGVRAAPQIELDPPGDGLSSPNAITGNGVWEPGETVIPRTAWVNDTATDVELSGAAPLFTGPAGADYTLNDAAANYQTIAGGATASCFDADDCYSITVSAPAVRPVQHWDAFLQETLSIGVPKTWTLHIGESFPDVLPGEPFYPFIETLLHNGITGGCAGGGYCPANPVTRAQMAVFLLKAKFGSAHIPPPCTGTVFTDVPCTGGPFDPWIEELAALAITSGCGGGLYCPGDAVTRQQMAVFLLKTLEGSTYVPPTCTGVFDDVPCTPGTGFSDWIEDLATRQITAGCSVSPPLYCPTDPNNRGQMAVFLVKTFSLVLYGG
jgi:hypothetical protein